MDKFRARNDSVALCRLRSSSPARPPLALQLNPILASGLITLALQLGISPGRTAGKADVVLLAEVPIAIPLQDSKTPKTRPTQSNQPYPIQSSPIIAAPISGPAVQPSPAAELGKPGVFTPTTGLVTIESDLQKADNTTGIVTATGNVRIVYPDQRVVATARQAQYYSKEGRIVLSGDVDVIQADGHSIKAERVVYDVNRERMIAEPTSGGQVFSRYRMNSPSSGIGGTSPGQGGTKP